MFKNLFLYRLSQASDTDYSQPLLEQALERCTFAPCQSQQQTSAGFVPPRGLGHGALVEIVDGHIHLAVKVQTKSVPAQVLRKRVDEMAAQLEEQTGRKPGKKARKDLAEQALHELLPHAFAKDYLYRVWIDPGQMLMAVDAGSPARAEEIISLLVKTVDGLGLHLIQSAEAPSACMAAWLMDGVPPEGFAIDRECELKSEDEMKSAVRYARHALDIEEVRQHLASGKRPTRLAMTFKDRVSFVLTDGLVLKKLEFLDLVFEGRDTPARDERFDADLAIATGELSALVAALIEALGGEHVFAIEAAAAGQDLPQYPAPHMPSDGPDPLYDKAVEVVMATQRASISLIQRHLQIGYNRAARMLEQMERSGLVSPMGANGARAVREGAPA